MMQWIACRTGWKKKKHSGAMTLEATIVFPIFMFAVLTIAFFTKVIYIQNQVQSALNQAAIDISTYSYMLQSTGLMDAHQTINDQSQKLQEPALKHAEQILNSMEAFQNGWTETKNLNEQIQNGDKVSFDSYKEIYQNLKSESADIRQIIVDIKQEPKKELAGILSFFARQGFDAFKSYAGREVARFVLEKHLNKAIFKKVHVGAYIEAQSGDEGKSFNLTGSSFFEDNKTIDLVVRYSVQLKLPVNIVPEVNLLQRATVAGWLNGDASYSDRPSKVKTETSYWELPATTRGKAITKAELNKLNLSPENAVEVRSIDTTSASYQKPEKIESTVSADIKKFAEKNNSTKERPKEQIFILVLPEEAPMNSKILENIQVYAANLGIELRLVRGYGKANT